MFNTEKKHKKRKSIKNSRTSQLLLQLLADTLAIWFSFALQLYFRFFSGVVESPVLPTFFDYMLGSVMVSLFWYFVFFLNGMYQNWYLRSPFDEFFALVRSSFIGCFILTILVLSDSLSDFRFLFLLYFVVTTFSFVFFRFFGRRVQLNLRRKRIIKIPVLIVGDFESSAKFYLKSLGSLSWGIDVQGFVFLDNFEKNCVEFEKKGIPFDLYLGNLQNFEEIIDKSLAEEIIISTNTSSKNDAELLFSLAAVCTDKNIRVNIEPHLYDYFMGQSRTQSMYGIPLIEISTKLLKPWETFIKRFYDVVFSFLVMILGMPFWLLIALIVKVDSKGSAFYTQTRIGKNNEEFTIYKFRSMIQEESLAGNQQNWTIINDPRVTRFGRILRKTHIDEIPQFWNVLKGDMSIIGPRPEQPKFVDKFASKISYYKRRHIVRPGITGWGQIYTQEHSQDIEFIKKRTKYDFYYIENISLRLDLEIMLRTIWAMLRGQGQA